jgi:hypothetical protein
MIVALFRSWPARFIVAWAICGAGMFCAMSRGFNTHPLGDLAGTFLVGSTLVSWLGLTASFNDKLRLLAQNTLGDRWGRSAVAIALTAIGVILLGWSYRRVPLQLTCHPEHLTVWLNGERQEKPCQSKIWTSENAWILAHADGFHHFERSVRNLPREHDSRLLRLDELPRWSCSLHGGSADDASVFAACGVPLSPAAPWLRSRTWSMNISLRENAKAPERRPSLLVAAKIHGIGVAIQSTNDECYSRAADSKAPQSDSIDLAGCGQSGNYSVNVTVCAAQQTLITSDATEWMTLKIQESDERPYECAVPGVRQPAGGAARR